MKVPPQASKEQRTFEILARAAALFGQLPDSDMEAARAIVARFNAMAQEAGLIGRRPQPVLVSVAGGGGNSPSRRANSTGRAQITPE